MKDKIKEGLIDIFFPSCIKCIVCGDDIPYESRFPICKECKPEFNIRYCMKCGRTMPADLQFCVSCKDKAWNFVKARAPFAYCGEIKRLIHRLKYGNGKYIAKEVAVYLADAYYEHNLISDIITFVPMFCAKQKKRGYNQAEELAVWLGKSVECEVKRLLDKTAMGKSMAKLNAAERQKAIKDTFSADLKSGENDVNIKGKKILIVDDVFTTGSTANECAKVLMSSGAAEVNILTLATAAAADNRKQAERKLKDIL